MKINPANNSRSNLINLIIDANPHLSSTLTVNNVTNGNPVVFAGPAGRNTKITLTAVLDQGFSGSADVLYTRLGMSSGVVSVPTSISIFPNDTQEQIKQKVASALGLIRPQLDYTVGGNPWNETTNPIGIPANEHDTSKKVSVLPIANSLLYVGSALEVTLTVPDTDIPLTTALSQPNLNGFETA